MLPNVLVIGAMKCGTTVVHRYLGAHPDVALSDPKELNFFAGPATAAGGASWYDGNWHRGVAWYASRFADAPVRVDASPAYTSPAHPEAAERIAGVLPDARLVYLVRDPLARAVSQWLHHRADGTERRPLEEALLDPASQYLARSRFHERLAPFLERFPREGIAIHSLEELQAAPEDTMRALCAFAGVDPDRWPAACRLPPHGRGGDGLASARLRARFAAAVADDAERLRELTGRELAGWTV